MFKKILLKKEILLPLISIIVVLIALIGISYAIFIEEETTSVSVVKFGDIEMNYTSSSPKIGYDSLGNPVNMYPMTQAEAIATTPYAFTLTNTGDINLWVTIYLEKDTSFVPSGNYASYLNSDNTNIYYGIKETAGSLTSGLYSNVESSGIIKQLMLESGVTKTFNLWAWLKSDAPNTAQGTYFVADIRVRGEYRPDSIPLADAIKVDNPEYVTQVVENDTMFQSVATTDMGLWTENRAGNTENGLPVYFFRGDIDNNYVYFAGKMWRIVRINEDGSVKLILGGNTTTDGYGGTTKFNPSSTLAQYADYNHTNNVLRAANADWYTNDTKGNLDAYETYIADTKFCNDKSVVFTYYGEIYYGAYERIFGSSLDGNFTPNASLKYPQYKCPIASDNYIYKIGALTVDEIVYAGGLIDSTNTVAAYNTSYYLYDNAQGSGFSGDWWLLSPFDFGLSVYVFSVSGAVSSGVIGFTDVIDTISFRPVISLKSDTLILSGNGTFSSPYVITQ